MGTILFLFYPHYLFPEKHFSNTFPPSPRHLPRKAPQRSSCGSTFTWRKTQPHPGGAMRVIFMGKAITIARTKTPITCGGTTCIIVVIYRFRAALQPQELCSRKNFGCEAFSSSKRLTDGLGWRFGIHGGNSQNLKPTYF